MKWNFHLLMISECRGQLAPNKKWLKYRKGNCYNCECIDINALCTEVTPICLPVNCENPIIPPAKTCRCPTCPSTESKCWSLSPQQRDNQAVSLTGVGEISSAMCSECAQVQSFSPFPRACTHFAWQIPPTPKPLNENQESLRRRDLVFISLELNF